MLLGVWPDTVTGLLDAVRVALECAALEEEGEGKDAMSNVYVEIVEIETGKVEKRMGPMSEHKAERVERGVLINMSEHYFVRTVPETGHPSNRDA